VEGAAFEIIRQGTNKSRKSRARKMYIGNNLHESPYGILSVQFGVNEFRGAARCAQQTGERRQIELERDE
jgi:hypothetical protein